MASIEQAPQEPDLQTNVSRIVRALMGSRGMKQGDLAGILHVSRSGVTEKLSGRRKWSVDDLDAMGRFFDVSPATFFEEPEALFRSRCFSLVPPIAGQIELDFEGAEGPPPLARVS